MTVAPDFTQPPYREWAKIQSVFVGMEDHGIHTVVIQIEGLSSNWVQGFGCLSMRDEADEESFLAGVLGCFGLRDRSALPGQQCFVLRSFSFSNSPIEGLEDPMSGRRFTLTAWRRARLGVETDPLARESEQALYRIRVFRQRVVEEEQLLSRLAADFCNWEPSHG